MRRAEFEKVTLSFGCRWPDPFPLFPEFEPVYCKCAQVTNDATPVYGYRGLVRRAGASPSVEATFICKNQRSGAEAEIEASWDQGRRFVKETRISYGDDAMQLAVFRERRVALSARIVHPEDEEVNVGALRANIDAFETAAGALEQDE